MLLRNFDSASTYFNSQLKIELKDINNPKINGWYKIINDRISALFVRDSQLYFKYGSLEKLINGDLHVVINKKSINEAEFSLCDEDNVLVNFLYDVPNSIVITSPFEYLNDDDFQWGIFIMNIINDKERRGNFIRNLSS